jgi:tetratricopeptide (TPR) repeat protein
VPSQLNFLFCQTQPVGRLPVEFLFVREREPMNASNDPDDRGVSSLLARPRFLCLLLAFLTLIVFSPVRNFEFLNYDDPLYVTSNAHVQQGLTLSSITWALGATDGGNWHPLTWLSHMLDVELFGAGAAGPHVVNVLFHAANTLLLFLVLRTLTAAYWRSALVAALFALHPLHVESVAWVSERKDVLSMFLFLLTLWAYGRYARRTENGRRRTEHPDQRAEGRSPTSVLRPLTSGNYWLALVFFALGLMSKPMLVTLPFLLLLLDYWPLARMPGIRCQASDPRCHVSGGETAAAKPATLNSPAGRSAAKTAGLSTLWRLIREKTLFFLLSGISCALTYLAQKKGGAVMSVSSLSLGLRIENAFVSYARYLGKLFWPMDLAVPYPHPGHWPWLRVAVGIVLVFGVSAAALRLGRRLPFGITGWFWFLGTLIPVIGLVQVGNQSLADRYTYLPLVGMFVVFSWGAAAAAARWQLPPLAQGIGALLVLCGCALGTTNQLRYWHDSGSLFRHALASSKNNYVAHDNLSSYWFNQGRVEEAMEQSREALRIEPEDPVACVNLGHGLFIKGRLQEAIESFRRAVAINPDYAAAWSNLGTVFLEQKEYEETLKCFEAAARIQPDNPAALNDLGGLFLLRKQYPEAVRWLETALRLQPDYARAHVNLAAALHQLGRVDEAVSHYEEALRLTPDDAVVHVLLAGIFLHQGRVDDAIAHYREALRIDPAFTEARQKLQALRAPVP